MPVPAEYQRIHDELYQFLMDVRDIADIETTHRAYTVAQGVFQTFRRRISIENAVLFCNALPAGIRALFCADWDPFQEIIPFSTLEIMNTEVRNLRADHNFAPETAIQDVAKALWKNTDQELLTAQLSRLPVEARYFWSVC